jgi:cytochrome c-type biogenesis protein CcmE
MVDSKSKIRLGIVSAVLLLAIGYMIFTTSLSSYSIYKQISEIKKDPTLIGKSVEVGGRVKKGSVVHRGTEMSFVIVEKAASLNVVYTGQVPQTFGDDVQAVITGKLESLDKLVAKSIITKCPSKYEGENVDKMDKDKKTNKK